MAKRFTDNDKWKKKFFRNLSMEYKLLWIYILDDCNHAGIWDVDLDVASLRIGNKIGSIEFTLDKCLEVFEDQVVSFKNGDKWFIPDFICFQYGTLNPNSRVHQSVIQLLEKHNLYQPAIDCDYIEAENSILKPSKAITKRFVIPTLQEIKDYCAERKNLIDPEQFFDFYTSKNWMIGKNKMKCWKSAVRTWERNHYEDGYDKRVKVHGSKISTNLQTWKNIKEKLN